ncbi:unnamed protein product [Prorocentrum cordatum]|uniref:Uncharacterized protein n=2 Tax=Prorocentrum cordatum TaxID=2364126 RepID=A0ABN9TSW8_9DINO|nr:unnamed protein product [Polarella glacialis]
MRAGHTSYSYTFGGPHGSLGSALGPPWQRPPGPFSCARPSADSSHPRGHPLVIRPLVLCQVWLDPDSFGLAVETFADGAAAEAKLASLGPDEFGEGGGVIFKGGKVVSEKLFLKFMRKADFGDFLRRATEPPAAADGPDDEAKLEAVVTRLSEKLSEMTELAPQIEKLLEKYKVKGKDAPVPIYGRPSPALVHFARMFPQYVHLGAPAPDLLRV